MRDLSNALLLYSLRVGLISLESVQDSSECDYSDLKRLLKKHVITLESEPDWTNDRTWYGTHGMRFNRASQSIRRLESVPKRRQRDDRPGQCVFVVPLCRLVALRATWLVSQMTRMTLTCSALPCMFHRGTTASSSRRQATEPTSPAPSTLWPRPRKPKR